MWYANICVFGSKSSVPVAIASKNFAYYYGSHESGWKLGSTIVIINYTIPCGVVK
jgi:hypothetical protein